MLTVFQGATRNGHLGIWVGAETLHDAEVMEGVSKLPVGHLVESIISQMENQSSKFVLLVRSGELAVPEEWAIYESFDQLTIAGLGVFSQRAEGILLSHVDVFPDEAAREQAMALLQPLDHLRLGKLTLVVAELSAT